MFQLGVNRIFLARDTVDMRKSYNTLADLVKFNLDHDPYSGDAFVFVSKRKNRLKILIWEDSGFWLCSKRLERGTFNINSIAKNESVKALSTGEWHNFLEGLIVIKSKQLKRYKKN